MLRETLKRKARADYLRRQENAARTVEEFNEVVDSYDKLDENRERRERYHEIGRSENKLLKSETEKADRYTDPEQREAARENSYSGGAIIPPPLCHPYWRELMRGDFINYIFDSAGEMWQIVGDWQVGRLLKDDLTDKQKESLFLSAVRLATTEQIGCYTDKTDRAVRRLLADALERIRIPLASMIKARLDDELPVTLEKRRFLEWYEQQNEQKEQKKQQQDKQKEPKEQDGQKETPGPPELAACGANGQPGETLGGK